VRRRAPGRAGSRLREPPLTNDDLQEQERNKERHADEKPTSAAAKIAQMVGLVADVLVRLHSDQ
jgi:hypothetical protein